MAILTPTFLRKPSPAGGSQHGVSLESLPRPPQDEEEFDDEVTEYDPWESFNRTMFAFNRKLDRYVLKPVAKVWNFVVPDLAQQSLANAFDNIAMPRRLINSLLQLKLEGAGRELARFFLNISMGVGGFFDVATELGDPHAAMKIPDKPWDTMGWGQAHFSSYRSCHR